MLESRSGVSAFFAGAATLPFAFGLSSPCDAAVTISTAQTQNMTCTNGVCTPTAATAVLNVNDLTNLLAGSNVVVNTGTGSIAQQVEDIIVAASFNWASANALTLDAYRSVTFTSPIADNGAGAVSFVTNDGGSGGTLSFISGGSLSFLSPTNPLTVNGKIYTLASSISELATDIAAKPSGYYALSASYNASGDGTYAHSPIQDVFKGTFNGLGNTISNLTIDSNKKMIGLFASTSPKGTIDSVRVMGANIRAGDGREKAASSVGPLVAVSLGTVFNASASGQIVAKVGKFGMSVGGLVGASGGAILDSSASTVISASSRRSVSGPEAGGLVGISQGTVELSYATGTVSASGMTTVAFVGGLVGFSDNNLIENCYAEAAAAVANSSSAGGLTGVTFTRVLQSYSTGAVTAGSGSNVGGFVGVDHSNGGLSNTYWDTTTSGITNLSQGAGNIANDPGITGLTSQQLQSGLPAGFDPTIWAENPNINGGFPYLIANPPQ